MPNQTLAQLGQTFNTVTDELIGGVSPINKQSVLNQLQDVQQGVQALVNAGTYTGDTLVHAQNVADQINFLTDQIQNYGANAFAPKFINDVQRDIQDIVQGDNTLAAAAGTGFQQTSNLLVPPTPFADNTGQHDFLINFGNQSNALGAQAVADVGGDPAAIAQDIANLQAFQATNTAFVNQQSGLYQARFQNELGTNSVSWTAANELIKALQTGDHQLAQGAATVLSQNAADIQGNNSFNGVDIGTGLPVPTVVNGGIPQNLPDVHTAGTVFDDATTKIIGGVYSGNKASIVNDLHATATGLTNAIANQNITGDALQHLNTVINMLNQGAALVAGLDTANPTQVSFTNAELNVGQAAILQTINNDPTLHQLADGAFVPNPHADPGLVTAANHIPGNIGPPMDFSHMWHHA